MLQKWREVPVVSVTLVAINVIIFIICTFTGNLLYNMGELGVQEVLFRKECGRIIGAMFLHADFSHIFNNMVILFFLGAMIEKEVGPIWYLFIYILSGIGGNLLSLIYKVITYERACSVGASGAVFGLDGLMLALVLFSGQRMQNVASVRVILMIAYSLYSGFMGNNVDNAAHVGGLLIGFLLGIVFCIVDRIRIKKNGSERWNIEH